MRQPLARAGEPGSLASSGGSITGQERSRGVKRHPKSWVAARRKTAHAPGLRRECLGRNCVLFQRVMAMDQLDRWVHSTAGVQFPEDIPTNLKDAIDAAA